MKDHVRANWRATVLVCRKCSKRQKGGFGPDGGMALAKALSKATDGGRKRKAAVGVVEVACLGVCPKHAVVALNAARPAEWLLVAPGTAVEAVVARLGLADAAVRPRDGAPDRDRDRSAA